VLTASPANGCPGPWFVTFTTPRGVGRPPAPVGDGQVDGVAPDEHPARLAGSRIRGAGQGERPRGSRRTRMGVIWRIVLADGGDGEVLIVGAVLVAVTDVQPRGDARPKKSQACRQTRCVATIAEMLDDRRRTTPVPAPGIGGRLRGPERSHLPPRRRGGPHGARVRRWRERTTRSMDGDARASKNRSMSAAAADGLLRARVRARSGTPPDGRGPGMPASWCAPEDGAPPPHRP
jgi:hypothetical protein